MRHLDIDNLCAEPSIRFDGLQERASDLRVQPWGFDLIADHPDPGSLDRMVLADCGQVVWHIVRQTGRVPRIVACDRLKDQGDVFDALGKDAGGIEAAGIGDQSPPAHAAVGRLQSAYAAEGCRLADRASGVGPEARRDHTSGDGCGRPAAGASASALQIPWVAARSKNTRLGRAPHGKLVEIRFSKQDRAGAFEPLDDVGIVGGTEIAQHPRTATGNSSLAAKVVFNRDRDPGQCWDRLARCNLPIPIVGLGQGPI